MVAGALIIYAPWHLVETNRFEELIAKSYFSTFDQGEFGGWNWMNIAWRFDLRYFVFLWTFLRWWFPIFLFALIYQFGKFVKLLSMNSVSQTSSYNVLSKHLPFISFVVIFLALSAAKAKNDWYIMPAYPFIALLITGFFHQIFRRKQLLMIFIVLAISISNLYLNHRQAFPPDKHLPEKQVALEIKNLTEPDEIILTAEYEFPTLRYYSQREVRTSAPQQDYEGKYWWVWDSADIATALRRGQKIITVHRPGTEWSIDIWGYHRIKIGEINGKVISRIVPGN
jgi:hypothetical protein